MRASFFAFGMKGRNVSGVTRSRQQKSQDQIVHPVHRHRLFVTWLCGLLLTVFALTVTAASLSRIRTTSSDGDVFVTLRDMARFYNLSILPHPGKYITAKSKWSELRFEVDSRKAHMNGIQVWLHSPIQKVRRHWSVTQTDLTATIDPLLRSGIYLRDQDCKVVVLDPGHGGRDRGARGRRGTEEKSVNLDIARKARVRLANEGFRVYLTRDGDRGLTLSERTASAAKWRADVFISIHLNSSTASGPKGVETYIVTSPGYDSTNASRPGRTRKITYKGNHHEGANMALGYLLQRSLLRKTQSEDRGLRRSRFMVLKEAPCPAALIECGFLSNQEEEHRLQRDSYRDAIADAICEAVVQYSTEINRAKAAQ